MSEGRVDLPDDYPGVLAELKGRIQSARAQAHRVVNTALVELYWSLGNTIRQRQSEAGWGSKVVSRLSTDLRDAFPNSKGFGPRNLVYMSTFAAAYPEPIAQQPVAQLAWGHITVLLDKLGDRAARDRYAAEAVHNGWSRNVLLNQIMNRTLERRGAATTNFMTALPSPDSELAQQIAKDPYVFDFLDLSGEVAERTLENALMTRLVETLRELGTGFAFVGRQVHFDVDGDDFYVDLLFFHVEQLRYVVVELKTSKFKPEHAGQLGFYVALVDDVLKRPAHAPTVGILVCADRNERTVRYSLGRSAAPMAVSTYTYESLPPAEQHALPKAADLVAAVAARDEFSSSEGASVSTVGGRSNE